MAGFALATVGDNCIDRYARSVGISTVGGNAVNVAVQLSRQGWSVGYFGAVGSDGDGVRTSDCLLGNGVDIAHLRVADGMTAFTEIDVGSNGDRRIGREEFGVCRGYCPSPTEVELLLRLRHVHIGWLDDGGTLKRTLIGSGVSVSQDLGVNADPADLRGDGLSIAFMSGGGTEDHAESMARAAVADGARIAVVTCGARGSMAFDGMCCARTGSAVVDVVDTTGAGDTFAAGFIAAHLAGRALQACLESGRDAAAKTCAHLGGFPQVARRLAYEMA